jgi:hypothetical protein
LVERDNEIFVSTVDELQAFLRILLKMDLQKGIQFICDMKDWNLGKDELVVCWDGVQIKFMKCVALECW